jgi:hypothetical protein
VFFPSLVVNEDVIQIQNYKSNGEFYPDHPHESGWRIFQTKGHDQPFKKTFLLLEGGLPYICLFYRDLVVAKLQINITEVFGPHDFIKEVVDSGNWIPVSDCDFIQGSVINAESPGSIFLIPTRLGPRKVMSWNGCAPCGEVLGSIT